MTSLLFILFRIFCGVEPAKNPAYFSNPLCHSKARFFVLALESPSYHIITQIGYIYFQTYVKWLNA